MLIRSVRPEETEAFFRMMCRLDEETPYMMYEPGEREQTVTGLDPLRRKIAAAYEGDDLLLAAQDDAGELQGFLWAERGVQNRIRHTAYIVVGIRSAYRHQGIGTKFFEQLDCWAKENGVTRLELTVFCENTPAVRLYRKMGFEIEGIRRNSMKLNGVYKDEYAMAKILGGQD